MLVKWKQVYYIFMYIKRETFYDDAHIVLHPQWNIVGMAET